MNHSPIIKILTPQSSIKINEIKKLLFQAPTFKNNLFNTFTHLADVFIQSDLQLPSGYTFSSVSVFPGNRTHNLLRC